MYDLNSDLLWTRVRLPPSPPFSLTKGKAMKTAKVGNNVLVHYKGTLSDGTVFDNSYTRGEPLPFTVGTSELLSAFSEAVEGMTEGQVKTTTLSPDEAYGHRREDAFQRAPKSAFGPDFVFEVGGAIQGSGPQGVFLATIQSIEETEVVLDINHPLAGKDLTFEIELVEIQTTTSSATATMLEGLKVSELRAVAKERGIKGYTKLKKAELLELLGA